MTKVDYPQGKLEARRRISRANSILFLFSFFAVVVIPAFEMRLAGLLFRFLATFPTNKSALSLLVLRPSHSRFAVNLAKTISLSSRNRHRAVTLATSWATIALGVAFLIVPD